MLVPICTTGRSAVYPARHKFPTPRICAHTSTSCTASTLAGENAQSNYLKITNTGVAAMNGIPPGSLGPNSAESLQPAADSTSGTLDAAPSASLPFKRSLMTAPRTGPVYLYR